MSRYDGEAPRGATPSPGLFKLQLVRGGPYVAARINHAPTRDPLTNEQLDRSWYFEAEIDGASVDEISPSPSATVWQIWEFGVRINDAEHRYLIELASYARQHAPHEPIATPYEPIDLNKIPPLF